MFLVALILSSNSLTIEINGQQYTDSTYNGILEQYGDDITTITSIIVVEGSFQPVSFKKYTALKEMVVPYESFTGKISISWFRGLQSLVYIEFGGCSALEEHSFDACSSLEEVSLPYCTDLGNYAFYNCISLSSVYLPSVSIIRHNAFRNTALKEIELPSLTSVKANYNECYSFARCTSLKYVSIPQLAIITTYMFRECSSLKEIYAPSCTSILTNAFKDSNSISTITFGLPEVEFSSIPSPSMIKNINFPAATEIDLTSFSKLYNLVSCKLGSVTEIGDNTFQDFTQLSVLELPSVVQIGKDVFQNCAKLTSLSLRNLKIVDSTSPDLFSGCKLLNTIFMPDSPPQTFHKDTFKGLKCKIQIPLESSSVYDDDVSVEGDEKGDGYWCGIPLATQKISLKINDDDNIYSGDELSDCISKAGISESLVKSLIIENGVLNLQNFASSINMYSSLEDLKITNLASLNGGLTQGIFSGLTLSSFIIDIEIDTVPTECFKNCVNLKKVYINNCKTVKGRCFSGCINLQEVVLNTETLTEDYHFEGCSSLETVSLRKLVNVDSTSEHIFTDCSLASIYLPPSQPPRTFNKNTFIGKDVIIQGLTNSELKSYDQNTDVEGDVANDNKWCGILLSNSYLEISLNDNDFVSTDTIENAIKLSNVVTITKIIIKGGMVKKSHFNEIASQDYLDTLIIQETAKLESYILDSSLFKDQESLHEVSIMLNISLASECFSGCTSLTKVEFGSCNSIADKCFYGCTSLNSLIIPNCYSLQGDNIFANCNKLALIDLSSLKNVDETATSIFYQCTSLKTLYLPSKEPYKFNKNTFVDLQNVELKLPFPDDYTFYDDKSYVDDDVAEDNMWCGIQFNPEYSAPLYNFKINGVFYKRRSLSNIKSKKSTISSLRMLNNDEEAIEIKSFELVEGRYNGYDIKTITYRCSTLEKFIAQPLTLNEILADTFNGCTSLKEITILSNASIGINSLQGLANLNTLTLSYTNYVHSNEFEGDKNLQFVSLPSLMVVPHDLFNGFNKLESVSLHSAIQLDGSCFMDCSSLKTIDLKSATILIGDYHFTGCKQLSEIDFSSLETVDKNSSHVFGNCNELKTLRLSNEPPKMFNKNIFVNAGTIPIIKLNDETGWQNYVKQCSIDPETNHYIWYGFDSNISYELNAAEKSVNKKSGVSKGSLAAAIIISIIGAAAISAVVTYFVLKKKKKEVSNSPEP